MNYIKHLTGFFERVTKDKELNPTHVSLYMSLFQFWNCNRFRNPISISRDEVMRISKISSKATYHKCLKGLHSLGYIKYEPSYNPFKGSHVIMFNFSEDLKPQPKTSSKNEPSFEPVTEQVLNNQGTSTKQALVPYINNTNHLNSSNDLNLGKLKQNLKNENDNSLDDEDISSKEKKFAFDIKRRTASVSQVHQAPELEEVQQYFQQHNFPEIEAQKFYNYFSSIGWLVGGKSPMIDWQAAAKNWMLNADKFNTTHNQSNNQNLSTITSKNYAEPL
ncbi:transcriptional regulator [Flavobacterium sp. UBA7682]|uniref:transcriptional regulator n=1 Tax=Flavobacterium sp. UBA7682 TaxID=1946560 RepID=UPI0025BA1555|nr:transcriptional regulator [Flavobacterium sp. UBA7682]